LSSPERLSISISLELLPNFDIVLLVFTFERQTVETGNECDVLSYDIQGQCVTGKHHIIACQPGHPCVHQLFFITILCFVNKSLSIRDTILRKEKKSSHLQFSFVKKNVVQSRSHPDSHVQVIVSLWYHPQ
jgi:hypothetical protein